MMRKENDLSRKDHLVSTTRIPPALDAAITRLAERDGETKASIVRRLLRVGLDMERRSETGR